MPVNGMRNALFLTHHVAAAITTLRLFSLGILRSLEQLQNARCLFRHGEAITDRNSVRILQRLQSNHFRHGPSDMKEGPQSTAPPMTKVRTLRRQCTLPTG